MLKLKYSIRSFLRILPKQGQKTITMSGKRLIALEEKYNQEKNIRPTLSFSAFIAESALMELERRQILREAPFISLIGIYNNIITLKDAKNTEKFVEVQFGEKKPKCSCGSKQDCIHVGFALALPEVRKALRSKA